MRAQLTMKPESTDQASAFAIADELVKEAIWSGDQCTFFGAQPAEQAGEAVAYASTGADVYEGSAGIARFLFQAARYSGSDHHRQTAEGALLHACKYTEGSSLFSGATGVALVALESQLPVFHKVGLQLLEAAVDEALAEATPSADLLAGLAGIIVGITNAWPRLNESIWSGRISMLAQRLADLAVTDTHGMKWPLYPGSTEYLCGLAHGASGVAMALDRAATVVPEKSHWNQLASDARRFERQHYSPEHGSWADLRHDEQQTATQTLSYPHMWCHGSIGIAAERLNANPADIGARADKHAAIEAVRANLQQATSLPRGAGGSDVINGSCCHGISSSVDVVLDCAIQSSSPAQWVALARQGTATMRDDARRAEGWRCGIPGGHKSPGLMLGIAGIGWTLLRTAVEAEIPSVWRIGTPKPQHE